MKTRKTYAASLHSSNTSGSGERFIIIGDEEDDVTGAPPSGGASFFLFCAQRRTWFINVAQALLIGLILLGVVGFGIAVVALQYARAPLTFVAYTQDVPRLPAEPLSYVAVGGVTPLTFTLPNDLSDYVGRTYNWDCSTPASAGVEHKIRIETGPLPTYWIPALAYRTAACNATAGGMTWHVVSKQLVRIVSTSEGVVFSP